MTRQAVHSQKSKAGRVAGLLFAIITIAGLTIASSALAQESSDSAAVNPFGHTRPMFQAADAEPVDEIAPVEAEATPEAIEEDEMVNPFGHTRPLFRDGRVAGR